MINATFQEASERWQVELPIPYGSLDYGKGLSDHYEVKHTVVFAGRNSSEHWSVRRVFVNEKAPKNVERNLLRKYKKLARIGINSKPLKK